jgi:hypothetical protein
MNKARQERIAKIAKKTTFVFHRNIGLKIINIDKYTMCTSTKNTINIAFFLFDSFTTPKQVFAFVCMIF